MVASFPHTLVVASQEEIPWVGGVEEWKGEPSVVVVVGDAESTQWEGEERDRECMLRHPSTR